MVAITFASAIQRHHPCPKMDVSGSTLREALEAAEIGYEIMSTPSACRTYNVRLTENRRVGAALVPV